MQFIFCFVELRFTWFSRLESHAFHDFCFFSKKNWDPLKFQVPFLFIYKIAVYYSIALLFSLFGWLEIVRKEKEKIEYLEF